MRVEVTAKATVLFATTASFGMLVMSMQNLGLVGMMTVEWPVSLQGLFTICQFLLLDIDSYGFSCIAGNLVAAVVFQGCCCVAKHGGRLVQWLRPNRICSLPAERSNLPGWHWMDGAVLRRVAMFPEQISLGRAKGDQHHGSFPSSWIQHYERYISGPNDVPGWH